MMSAKDLNHANASDSERLHRVQILQRPSIFERLKFARRQRDGPLPAALLDTLSANNRVVLSFGNRTEWSSSPEFAYN